ncbi:MAG TPA: hypothetical protein VEW90_10365 [Gaiellaceae bacterium]|nr:hypothetical protein [Gaiellaceae bacterium]
MVVTWAAALGAFGVSTAAVWSESGDSWQVAASLWIVALVGWLDMPVLQRFAASATSTAPERVLATLDDVELVASRANGLAIELAPGEHLALRRRPRA